jgi:hypothetical protein
MGIPAGTIDWERLLNEFEGFEPDEELQGMDALPFVRSLIEPCPRFVDVLVARKHRRDMSKAEAVRALYAFLLEKRYQEKLNLLHFAFSIFDEHTHLPQVLIDRTPFPHEDGLPRFTHINDPRFHVSIES